MFWQGHAIKQYKKQKAQNVKSQSKIQIKWEYPQHLSATARDGQAQHPATEAGEGAVQKRRQGRHRTSSSLGASQEEVRTTRSSSPQPQTDPEIKGHYISVGCRAGKRRRTPNWSSRWRNPKPRRQTSYGGRRRRWKHYGRHEP